jgi:hypothetical protein
MNNPEPFLAFTRGQDGVPSRLDAAVDYDIVGEIDQRNGWREPDEHSDELKHSLESIAARGLRELILFCFHGEKLTKGGAGFRRALQRFIGVSHSVHPEMFVSGTGRKLQSPRMLNGAPRLSLAKVSKFAHLRCKPKELKRLAKEFHDQWGFKVHVSPAKTQRPRKG